MDELLREWLEVKDLEQQAKERRALYEQKIFENFGKQGTHKTDFYNLKITPSIVRKVQDPQHLMKSLRENNFLNLSRECFAWEAKPKMQEIKKQSQEIQDFLLSFIETKENKPSISISTLGE